ncbi:patatin-like phospholipase domain-containing protein [Stieleria sp. ICT_E10.1]|uniref:patatin-like phospholipase family protein n=1 Tax=Stieleria sedimenti TaxID=2976331 RepID=UPI00218012BC|nr:cyclic nucleotide-binding and patatin-like phospholipase domain-containing protein [Stieleria sedimenti]MCS7465814.1 patatin-like phospholipase domain-containing protein [Stieleria sedimenti]
MDREQSVTRSLLMGLSNDGLENVLSAFQPRSFDAGATIIEIGDDGDELFLITAGKVRVWTGDGPAVAERTLGMMGAGDHFGESSVISGGPRTATVTAVTYVETLVLSGEDYRRLVKSYPQLLENLSRSLTKRLSKMNSAASSPRQTNRGVHSLAIVIDHPSGWPLAEQLIGQLRGDHPLVQPLLVSDEDLPFACESFDRDAICVSVADLGCTIAGRSKQALAVTVAWGPQATDAAVRESNRVVFAADAHHGLSDHAASLLKSIPLHRRAMVALMFSADSWPRPDMDFSDAEAVRCGYCGEGREADFVPASVTRLYRSLIGKRIGLALGGGGARGIAHIGVLEILQQHNVVFDSIAGTSAGAIVASAYGAGFTPLDIGDFFRKEMIPPKYLAGRPSLRRMFLLHSFRGGRFETKLRRYLDHLTFEQASLPLAITTLDLISGEQQIRRSGDLVQAVLQSINHPVFGRPIIHDGQMLVDGGVLMNVPASVLRSEGCDHVVSIDVGSTLATDYAKDRSGKLRRPSYLSTLLRTMDISRRHSSALHREESDLIIIPQTSAFRIEDFHAVDPLIDAGRRAGEKAVENVKRVIENLQPTDNVA